MVMEYLLRIGKKKGQLVFFWCDMANAVNVDVMYLFPDIWWIIKLISSNYKLIHAVEIKHGDIEDRPFLHALRLIQSCDAAVFRHAVGLPKTQTLTILAHSVACKTASTFFCRWNLLNLHAHCHIDVYTDAELPMWKAYKTSTQVEYSWLPRIWMFRPLLLLNFKRVDSLQKQKLRTNLRQLRYIQRSYQVPHHFPIHLPKIPHRYIPPNLGARAQMGASRVHTVATMAQQSSCWV